jgi:hypothetical protein
MRQSKSVKNPFQQGGQGSKPLIGTGSKPVSSYTDALVIN